MQVVLNTSMLRVPKAGIGHYVLRLSEALQKLDNLALQTFTGSGLSTAPVAQQAQHMTSTPAVYHVARAIVPRPRAVKRWLESSLFVRATYRLPRTTLYHEPNHLLLPFAGPKVVTVCDLSCFDLPLTHPQERVRMMARELPRSLENADHILAISRFTAEAISARFGVDPGRISVTHLAAGPQFHPMSDASLAPGLHRWGLMPKQYVLSVGTLEPRKNLEQLFLAYGSLPAAMRRQYPLVVAGMSGWGTGELMKPARVLMERGELHMLGYLEDQALSHLYAGARLFCYPSRYEGFGLPVLEAMACGVPVITSNRTSLPEVVGEAGQMVDPDDVDQLRNVMNELLDEDALCVHWAQRGLEHSGRFSWELCAAQTRDVYARVLAMRGVQ